MCKAEVLLHTCGKGALWECCGNAVGMLCFQRTNKGLSGFSESTLAEVNYKPDLTLMTVTIQKGMLDFHVYTFHTFPVSSE